MAGQAILQLPTAAIRLIGSGQVITSVYSVVKELVENAIDADATSVDVKLDDFGLEKVEVCDNGRGIKSVDITYVAKRHFTSKLVTTDDLLSLVTYGFRGEALASLCAVSSLTITTKTAKDDVSYIYTFDREGNVKAKRPSHLGTGSTISACNLFSNLPVRKQYYRSSQRKKDDLKKIEDFLCVIGIIKPNIRITLRHGRELVWQKTPLGDTKSVLQAVFQRQVATQLLYRHKDLNGLQGSICAYIPKPGSDVKLMSRASGDRTFIVINDRPVYVKELVKILKQYYSNCHACEAVRHPVCYVCITLPASDVDVNIDPNKTTVLLQHMTEVRICLEEILVEVYGPLENVPSWHYSEPIKTKQSPTNGEDSCNNSQLKFTRRLMKDTQENLSVVEETVSNGLSRPQPNQAGKEPGTLENDVEKEILRAAENGSSNPKPLPSFSVTFHQAGSISADKEINTNNACDQKTPDSPRQCDLFTKNREELDNKNAACQGFIKDLCGQETIAACNVSQQCLAGVSENSNMNGHEVRLCRDTAGDKNSVQNDLLIPTHHPDHKTGHSARVDLTGDYVDGNKEDDKPSTISSDWSKGHSIVDKQGQLVQPVQLLPPSTLNGAGKRPSSPSNESSTVCQPKRSKVSSEPLPSNQTTLLDIFTTTSDFELFCKEKKAEILETNGELTEEEISEQLEVAWESLSSDEKIKYRDKCWENKRRIEKEARASREEKSTRNLKNRKVHVRDELAAMASQSQAEKENRQLKQRLYHCEKHLDCDMTVLRATVKKREAQNDRPYFPKPIVIGQARSCDAWFCCHNNFMYLINVHRLTEMTLYKRLREEHKLQAKPCQTPICLDSGRLDGNQWSALELLAEKYDTGDIYFHVKDERLTANGFDVLCHRDADHKLHAELAGLCELIPTYDVSDLREVLDAISKNSSVDLANSRSTKALYYLQGEAVRMDHQSVGTKSTADVQDMVDQITDITDLVHCIHQKPVFHDLFDLSSVLPASCSLEALENTVT